MLSRWPALAFAAVLVAQGQAPTFRARADLVQVDVVVVDGEGNPVRGLHSADFVLRDRNKPQAIASFDEIAHDRRETAEPLPPGIMRDVSNNQDAQSGRLIVMVLDDLHVYKERTDRARAIARQVLADLGPQSSMAVLFTSQKNNTLVTQEGSRTGA